VQLDDPAECGCCNCLHPVVEDDVAEPVDEHVGGAREDGRPEARALDGSPQVA
jgi:hypothetical protein